MNRCTDFYFLRIYLKEKLSYIYKDVFHSIVYNHEKIGSKLLHLKICCRRKVLNLKLMNPLKLYVKCYVCVGIYIFLERKSIAVMSFSTQKAKYLAISHCFFLKDF